MVASTNETITVESEANTNFDSGTVIQSLILLRPDLLITLYIHSQFCKFW